MKKAVFIDRDGTLNDLIDRGQIEIQGKTVRYTAPWTLAELRIPDGTEEALRSLRSAGFLCIVITNQPDLTYGLLPHEEHEKIMQKIRQLSVDDIYFCPHGRDDGCECRKPKPKMLLDAAKKWDIDLASSYMVGDSDVDVEAGKAAGCTSVYVGSKGIKADIVAKDLPEAVQKILALQ